MDFKAESTPRVISLLLLQAVTWDTCPFFVAAPFILSISNGDCIVFIASKQDFWSQGIELEKAWDNVKQDKLDNLKELVKSWQRVSMKERDTLWVPPGHLAMIIGGRRGCSFWHVPLVSANSYLSVYTPIARRRIIGHNQKLCTDLRQAQTDWIDVHQGTVDSSFYLTCCESFLAKLAIAADTEESIHALSSFKFTEKTLNIAPGRLPCLADQLPSTPMRSGKRDRSLQPARPSKMISGGGAKV